MSKAAKFFRAEYCQKVVKKLSDLLQPSGSLSKAAKFLRAEYCQKVVKNSDFVAGRHSVKGC